jgi:anti-anti-sigma factor
LVTLQITVTPLDASCFVVCVGELDISTAPTLRSHLDFVRSHVLIDCQQLTFVDSVGLGEFMRIANRVESLALARAPKQLRRVIGLMGLSENLGLSREVPVT